jgi:hypothetical protein
MRTELIYSHLDRSSLRERLRNAAAAVCAFIVATMLSAVAHAAPLLVFDFAPGNEINVGGTTTVSLNVINLGVDEVVTAFDISLDYDPAIVTASGFSINTFALDTDSANSGAGKLANGTTLNFFGFTNAGVFNTNTFSDLKSLQGSSFTLAQFSLQGLAAGASLLNFVSPFVFAIETAATFGSPLDLGDAAAGADASVRVTAVPTGVPAPGVLGLVALGLLFAGRWRSDLRRRYEK